MGAPPSYDRNPAAFAGGARAERERLAGVRHIRRGPTCLAAHDAWARAFLALPLAVAAQFLIAKCGLQALLIADSVLQKQHQEDACLLRGQVICHYRACLEQRLPAALESVVWQDTARRHPRSDDDRHAL